MRNLIRVFCLITLLCTFDEAAATSGCPIAAPLAQPPLDTGGLTLDFRRWLEHQGLNHWNFARDDLQGGSFGGRYLAEDPIRQQPVILVHGNSDRALGTQDGEPLGWSVTLHYLLSQGYTPAELYATTWGPADPAKAGEQVHSWEHLSRLRAFIEAVLAYTGAEKVDVIAHSMGVTLVRKAIKGGPVEDPKTGKTLDLGPPLTQRVDSFVGIAGANLGLTSCFWGTWAYPTCSDESGFFPGFSLFGGVRGVSDFLAELNLGEGFEGEHIYSIWSRDDQLVGYGGLVYGRQTSRIPGQDGEAVFSGYPYGHFCVRDLSAPIQLQMIREHRAP